MSARDRAASAAYLPQERRIAWNMPALEVAAPFERMALGLDPEAAHPVVQ